ncbi:MAG: hypothetical protein V8T45_09395 [Oscillospiraceae bacterium]
MVDNSLRQMYRGGIFDHFGGGFSRYSTDREWLAPHFEKTLYDNALLSFLYTEAWQDGHMALYRDVAESTLDYCLRELKAEESSLRSGCGQRRGGRSMLSLFTPAEVKSVLGEDAGRHFCNCYDITDEGNFHGKSIPNLLLNNRWNFVPEGYDEYREKLRIYREQRMSLFTDDKILTGWNGLMLMALSRAAGAFNDRRYLMEAQELAAFMAEKLYEGGRLKARLCGGELRFDAQLDDLAFYALGLLELYRADFNVRRISAAQALAQEILENFADEKGSFSAAPGRRKSSSSVPRKFMTELCPQATVPPPCSFPPLPGSPGKAFGWRPGRSSWHFSAPPAPGPGRLRLRLSAHAHRGIRRPGAGLRPALRGAARGIQGGTGPLRPELTVLVKTPENSPLLSQLAPFTAEMQPQDGKAAYYICQNGSCSLPVTEL